MHGRLRRLGHDRTNLVAWREFLLVSGAVLVVGVWQHDRGGRGLAMLHRITRPVRLAPARLTVIPSR